MFRFDKYLVKTLKEINKKEHSVAACLYDYISNINTVITLRLEKLAKNELVKKILNIFPVFRKNIVMNELKWFTINI